MAIESGGISHMALRVTDLERAKQFYTETVGFEVMREMDGLVLMNAHGMIFALRGADEQTPDGDTFNPFRVGLDHIALTVDDASTLDTLKEQLDAAGARNNGVEDDAMSGAKYISFYDPDGIAWELYASGR